MRDQSEPKIVTANPWRSLRAFTDARIGLGRSGVSLPTTALLEFQLAHAQAQDAVHQPLDSEALRRQLRQQGIGPPLSLYSRASDRPTYLQRPDLGRRLDSASVDILRESAAYVSSGFDLAVTIVDGLSSRAIAENAVPILAALYAALDDDSDEWSLAPLTIVQQGRVAVGDEVGELLDARAVLVLIGERPGLSSPDSMGLYLTWAPRVGLTDASRNCVSNVRRAGLAHDDAVRKALYLLKESRKRGLSGVNLKERSADPVIDGARGNHNFLVPGPAEPAGEQDDGAR